MKNSDCKICKVAQKEFGDLCSLCHYTGRSNEFLQKQIDEQNEKNFVFWARTLEAVFVFLLLGLLILIIVLGSK